MNIHKVFAVFCLIAAVLVLTGCKKPNFGVRLNEDSNIEIIAENASKGFMGAAGVLTVENGQKLVIDSDLKDKSEILVKLIPASGFGMDASAEDLLSAMTDENAETEITVKGKSSDDYEVVPGDYTVRAESVTKSNGTIVIRVK